MPDLSTSELNSRMQQLDEQLVACLESFFVDTGVAIDAVVIDYNEKGYGVTLGLAFPEQ
jgi:hypothetical protein